MDEYIMEQRTEQPWYSRLFLPAYQMSAAARYVGIHTNTVRAWHHSDNPVLPKHEQGKALNYLELVEVAFVAFFRKVGLPMNRIRKARQYVADNLTAEYPLAEYGFKTEGMHILMEYDRLDHDANFEKLVVASSGGQLAWSELLASEFAEFEYEYNLAMRWHPAGPESKIIIDPRISFGVPVVSGLPTWAIKGRFNARETPQEIADEFGIPIDDVFHALQFEKLEAAAA